ncbi:hypothetical protein HF1_07480 [Mycoplasma haemofelis str. Langford 1]|uniref:Uncharacterized protein n=2 Tax=Mycoplasma haemofelis TaxID=29501 RepID=F6FIP2_MYCHI|nr:hypothetical protein [Mycoplasma haemofelis]AEG73090.1 hypothetical protein MHF_0826 [Mycoplasma haemofelis Ohio2]CBY92756.1 hypothetical protein HF1_07480 [Mycoplasma haemofelis str. Langford 1]
MEFLRYGLVLASCAVGGGGGLYYSSRPTTMRTYMINNGKTPLRSGDPSWRYSSVIKNNKDKMTESGMAGILGGNSFDSPTDSQIENLRNYCTKYLRKHPRHVGAPVRSNLETFCTY